MVLSQTRNSYVATIPISALKNKGITQVLDLVQDLLPCPKLLFEDQATTFLFIFKTQQIQGAKNMAFLKVLNGVLKKGDLLFNKRKGGQETIGSLYRIRANETQEIPEALAGDIIGIDNTDFISGDQLFV